MPKLIANVTFPDNARAIGRAETDIPGREVPFAWSGEAAERLKDFQRATLTDLDVVLPARFQARVTVEVDGLFPDQNDLAQSKEEILSNASEAEDDDI